MPELDKRRTEVVALQEELQEAQKKLQESVRHRQELLSVISHDLRSPVRHIVGMIDSLDRHCHDQLDASAHERMQRLRANAERLNSYIESLVEMHRFGMKNHPIEPVDTRILVADVLEEMGKSLGKHSIRVSVKAPMPVVMCSRDHLGRVFECLLDNAIRYMGPQPSPTIVIQGTNEPSKHIFSVQDNGKGIREPDLLSIFRPFWRAAADASEETEGQGMGLPTVVHLIELYHGSVWVDSEWGKGSTFWFSLPRREAP